MKTLPQLAGRRQRGSSLLEITIVMSLFTVVFVSSLAMIESGRRLSNSTMEITTVEDLAQQMLFGLERELANASGAEPFAPITQDFDAGASGGLTIWDTTGFPPTGFLLVGRGTPNEERIQYTSLGATTFEGLTRGLDCTQATTHAKDTVVFWSGLAEPIPLQQNPPAMDYDGISAENGVPVFFRGEGTGFSYRVPVDPAGGMDYVDGDDLRFGSEVGGLGPLLTGWSALFYLPKDTFDESDTGEDLNGDGDMVDIFDVGQVRRMRWDRTNPQGVRDDVGLGPSAVLQERCNWGGDLDNDGFDDPIFLWDKNTNILHVRLFVLGRTNKEMPIVREVETTMFLRNEPELE